MQKTLHGHDRLVNSKGSNTFSNEVENGLLIVEKQKVSQVFNGLLVHL